MSVIARAIMPRGRTAPNLRPAPRRRRRYEPDDRRCGRARSGRWRSGRRAGPSSASRAASGVVGQRSRPCWRPSSGIAPRKSKIATSSPATRRAVKTRRPSASSDAPRPVSTTRAGRARRARATGATGRASARERQRAQAGAAQHELEGLGVQRRRRSRGRARVEDQRRPRDATAGGATPLGGGQPAGGPAPGEAVLGRRRRCRRRERLDRRQQDLLDRALDRAHREALLEERGRPRPRRSGRRRTRRRAGDAGRRRARARPRSPDEMFWVSSNAARSASISARSNCRWPPAVRWGSGKPKRRSQERSVLGLTPSIAAAAFVRIEPPMSRQFRALARFAQRRATLGAGGQFACRAGAAARLPTAGRPACSAVAEDDERALAAARSCPMRAA